MTSCEQSRFEVVKIKSEYYRHLVASKHSKDSKPDYSIKRFEKTLNRWQYEAKLQIRLINKIMSTTLTIEVSKSLDKFKLY